jgi:uncharacterized protein
MRHSNNLKSIVSGSMALLPMKDFAQHGRVSTYDHCRRVARLSLRINRRLRLHADKAALLRGAMLHDFYLYDWHEPGMSHRLHGFTHPARAAENAVRLFHIGRREQDMIRRHMWPLTITAVPNSREGWILCLVDKYCSLMETLFMR